MISSVLSINVYITGKWNIMKFSGTFTGFVLIFIVNDNVYLQAGGGMVKKDITTVRKFHS